MMLSKARLPPSPRQSGPRPTHTVITHPNPGTPSWAQWLSLHLECWATPPPRDIPHLLRHPWAPSAQSSDFPPPVGTPLEALGLTLAGLRSDHPSPTLLPGLRG